MFTHTYTQFTAWLTEHREECISFTIGFALGLTTSAALYLHDYPFRAHFLDTQIEEFLFPKDPPPPPAFVLESETAAVEESLQGSTASSVSQSSIAQTKRARRTRKVSRFHAAQPTERTTAASSQQIMHEAPSDQNSASAFPAFERAVFPVSAVPQWGAMTVPSQWNRSYRDIPKDEFVALPRYNLGTLTTPMESLLQPRNTDAITMKLFYSTRFFGAYDVDADEFTGTHPGVDLKLALGTPVSAIAGGQVARVASDAGLGTYIVIEHRHPQDGAFFSVYGHLGTASVREGDSVQPGTPIGTVGMTGRTTASHLHLQIDRGPLDRVPYSPSSIPTPAEAQQRTVHPIRFITENAQ